MINVLISYLQNLSFSGGSFFIEAEGKARAISNFITDYNFNHSDKIDINSNGIIVLEEDEDKWGLELRLYIPDNPPVGMESLFTHNTVYRNEYKYRINNNRLIRILLEKGYRIGLN